MMEVGMDRAVIFDMDGVMVMTEEAHWRSWKAVAEDRGVDLSHERFLSCFGRVNADCVRIIFGGETAPDEAGRIADAKERRFREIIGARVPLAPGLVELLADLRRAGFKIAVGSSAPRENVDLVLEAGLLRGFFDAAIDGGQVKRGKPEPDVFLLAAEALDVPPRRCVVVEDAPAGITAALAAGMSAVGVTTTRDAAALRDAGAHRVFSDVGALSAEVVEQLIAECA
jgi:beta-phosphoglucomutase